MDQLYRLKETVIGYLSPKRRRTTGPTTPSPQLSSEQHLYEPASEPQGQRAQAALRRRIAAKYLSPPDSRFGSGSRKRAREDEYDITEIDSRYTSSEISPEESASQITHADETKGVAASDLPTEEGIDELEEELEEDLVQEVVEEEEISSQDKVAEYLARQAELTLRKEAIAEVRANGGWHPDEVFLFERLSMRSFEEVFPAEWKVDFPTLSGDLFTTVQEITFVDYNFGSSAAGEFGPRLHMSGFN